MSGFLEMMAAPVVLALVLVAMHSHLGWHVVRRGVIFVDIALAQVAAFGVAVSLILGGEIGSDMTHFIALVTTFLGAGLIALSRTRGDRVPQEAYIGIIYVVASASMILVLTQVPHGGEEIRHLLVGAILWVTWPVVVKTAVLYAALGGLLWLWRVPLCRISTDSEGARRNRLHVGWWDLVFYAILGTAVTSSVQVAGVLLVFALLVVPTVMAARLFPANRVQFVYAMGVGVLAVVAGSAVSYVADLPTGAAIVCVFGGFLVIQLLAERVVRR
ncbi:MAG: metal ABC transporter permease [Gemmatimonadota bacterium]|jgi:zinc/manganese transport system permease protein|nr:metal ABC transporter permease [Gemmatimonadota bacterium]MDP6530235.1 metal ABC transporter permease [Gemmatimonadota bacterium]MDP6801631.1 metal ABC transporter permease [Gemmatimonadota bacterium]MDP7030822.1 metal ABC transporter permease [Gemmatimonadota bacterium]